MKLALGQPVRQAKECRLVELTECEVTAGYYVSEVLVNKPKK